MRFDERDEQSRRRRAAAVEDVREFIFTGFGFETQIPPARLEIFAVRAARNFEVAPLPWCPDFDVISLRAAEAHVAGAKHDNTVMQAEQLQNFFRVAHHLFQFVVTVLRLHDFYQLHLVELMHADHSARANASRASLTAKAWRVSAVTDGQLFL